MGFTLVELLASVAVFSLIMVMSLGSILAVLDANHKSQTLRTVMDNLNFTLEGMTRSIRFGQNYHCGSGGDTTVSADCAGGQNSLTIKDSAGRQVTYFLSGTQIARSINGGTAFFLTSSDVTIQSLTFRVFGSAPYPGDLLQPQVIIVIQGYADQKNLAKSSFTLETTISQRKFDFQ